MAQTLYVTGFGPFSGIEENPTETIARSLDGVRTSGMRIVSDVLPVSFRKAPDTVRAALRAHSPRGILHFGLTPLDTIVRVESWATNEMTGRVPDADDFQPFEEPIEDAEDAPLIYETPIPVAQMVAGLRQADFPTRISRNAGRFVCNCVYYTTLDFLERNGSSVPALFVHLPPSGLHPFGDPFIEPWDAERLADAARTAVELFIPYCRKRS
jgi:pyroglutamyl-peptidase